MIIDSHTHVPARRKDWPVFIEACQANNISGVVTSCLGEDDYMPMPDADDIRKANAHAQEFAESTDLQVKWLAYINPQNDNCIEEMETCLSDGAVGVKLWVSVKSENSDLEKCFTVLDAAGKKNIPVLIHVMNRTDDDYPGEVDMAEFAVLARKFPDATLIAAHAGGNWKLSLGLLKGLQNAYVDISGFLPYKDIVKDLVEDLGADRILFGSDYTIRDIGAQLTKVFFAEITDRQKEMILWENASRIYNFDSPGSVDKVFFTAICDICDDLNDDTNIDFNEDHFCFCGSSSLFTSGSEPEKLDLLLDKNGIKKAFTACLGSICSRDLPASNKDFKNETEGFKRIEPLAALNPTDINWQTTLREAVDFFAGGIIFPYLHNWRLDDNTYEEFFRKFSQKGFPLWLNCCFDDYRFRPEGLNLREVGTGEIVNFVRIAPANNYIFQGLNFEQADKLLSSIGKENRSIRIDISRLTDFPRYLEDIIDKYGTGNLVFGSEYPTKDLRTVKWTAKQRVNIS